MKEKKISRRDFARRAAIASAAATVAPVALHGGTAGGAADLTASGERPLRKEGATTAGASAGSTTGAATVAQAPQGTPKLSAESQAEAEARYQAILSQYGKRFSDEQKTDLRRLCYEAQPPLDRLRAYNLANGDAPALYLKPLVDREKDPLAGTSKGRTPSLVTPRKRV